MNEPSEPPPRSVIIAITGASGAIYGIRTLQILQQLGVHIHLIISPTARLTVPVETGMEIDSLHHLANFTYDYHDLAAPIASGSYPVTGMLIVPCSIKTLSAIANSFANNLIVRSADVTLKEGRPLLLAVRETPLHRGHLRLMDLAARAGAIIFPPVPSFYGKPATIDDLVTHSVGRMLARIGINNPFFPVWKESSTT